MTCQHHYHQFLSNLFTTTYCCLCHEFEDRLPHEKPSAKFRSIDIVTRTYQTPTLLPQLPGVVTFSDWTRKDLR